MECSFLNAQEHLEAHRSVTGQNWEKARAFTEAMNQIPQLWTDRVNRLEIRLPKEAQEGKGL